MKGRLLIGAALVVLVLGGRLLAQPITIVHTPYYEFVNDSVNPYEIRAVITSTAGTITVKRVWYTLNETGSWQQLFMQPTNAPDEYVAYIPAQMRTTRIIYYIRAADSSGNVLNDPPNAPGAGQTGYLFRIGHYERLFFDDFESGDGGWTSGATAGDDDWMYGSPNQGGQNPNDPLAAYSGTNCWGNDLMGGTPQEGNYSPSSNNYLESPPFDFTGRSNLWLFYRRWLTVEQGIYDTARILVNGNEVWINEAHSHHLDTEWVPHDVLLSPFADNNNNVIIRLELNSDGGLEYGGWNFEDAEFVQSDQDTPSAVISDTTPSPGEQVTLTIQADPNTRYYVLAAKRQGQAFFQVPNGGPLVWTGLHDRSMKQYLTGQTDANGVSVVTKTVPNRGDLIGKVRIWVLIAMAAAHYVATAYGTVSFVAADG